VSSTAPRGTSGSGTPAATTLWVVAGIAVLAFVVRLLPVVRGGGLYGMIDYDDAVYFGAAVAWLHGFIPYRDFLLLHPPGILYVLSPFAALGTVVGDPTGFALARLAFMVLGALNTVLVALVAGRLGRREAVCAAALYAVWDLGAFVERTTWLIAPQNTLLLLALLVLAPRAGDATSWTPSTRRAALAGGLLGFAIAVQLWEVIPFAVVLGWVIVVARHRRGGPLRSGLAFIGAGGLALSIAGLPFLVAAGPQMLHYIVVDQVGRAAANIALLTRLRTLEGLPGAGPGLRAIPNVLVALGFVAVVASVALVAWRRPAIRLWALLAAVLTTVLLFLPVFFGHYKGWLAPGGSLAIGASVATILGSFGADHRRTIAARAAYGLVLMVLVLAAVIHRQGSPLPIALVDAKIANARCVTADSPVLLVETEALRRDLDGHCPLKLDPTGTSYDTDRNMGPGIKPSRIHLPEYQQAMTEYYGSGDAALFARQRTGDGFSPATWSAIEARLPTQTKAAFVIVLTSASPP
jgi:alpha-1,2-mannosyltransferase